METRPFEGYRLDKFGFFKNHAILLDTDRNKTLLKDTDLINGDFWGHDVKYNKFSLRFK